MAAVARVAVVGAGLMGTGIAEVIARAGIETYLHEPFPDALRRGVDRIERSLERGVEGGKLSAAEATEARRRLTTTADPEALGACDLAIEAVVEDRQVKLEVFRALDRALSEAAVIASNTSSIPIAELAAATGRPPRVLGLHFFSPANVMPLVEVVQAMDTSPETIAVAEGLVERIGKTAIATKDRSGFVVNMLLVPYLVAAARMYEEGFATAEAIDTGMRLGCGHPMGPLTLADFIGLDVLYAICDSLYDEFKQPEYAPPPLLKRMVAAGRLGRKSGLGFYDYENGDAGSRIR
jgi:3-hydroxybutyryl-CoA dehydrogenase